MKELDAFEGRLMQISKLMSKGSVTKSEGFLKALQKEVRTFIEIHQIDHNDRIAEIQIIIYNNLACLLEKRGKYRSSLYHLELAQKLQNAYFLTKYNGKQMPSMALQKLSTTYSNLSAIQSKLGNTKEALRNIQFAISVIKKSQDTNSNLGFIFLYYNYAVLLENSGKVNQASKYASLGLQICKQREEKEMFDKYEELLQRIKKSLMKLEYRKQRQIRKYTKGEIGVFKNLQDINFSSQPSEDSKQDRINSRWNQLMIRSKVSDQQYFMKKTFERPRFTSYRPSFSKQAKRKSSSFNAMSQGKMKPETLSFIQGSKKDLPVKNKTTLGIFEAYGLNFRQQKCSSVSGNRCIDTRIKERRRKLHKEISTIGQKNEALEKVIQRMCSAEGKAQQIL